MAEEKKTEKPVLEREYNVPLRKAFIKVPKYKKSNKAILGLKEFIKKHMKADSLRSVKISGKINDKIWENGIRNPPHHVKVKAIKYETYVAVELAGEVAPEAPKKAEEKKAKAPAKKAEKKAETKEDKKPVAKKEDKAESKESEKKTEEKPKKEAKEKAEEKPEKKAEEKKE